MVGNLVENRTFLRAFNFERTVRRESSVSSADNLPTEKVAGAGVWNREFDNFAAATAGRETHWRMFLLCS